MVKDADLPAKGHLSVVQFAHYSIHYKCRYYFGKANPWRRRGGRSTTATHTSSGSARRPGASMERLVGNLLGSPFSKILSCKL